MARRRRDGRPTRTLVMCEENTWRVADLSVPPVTGVTVGTAARHALRRCDTVGQYHARPARYTVEHEGSRRTTSDQLFRVTQRLLKRNLAFGGPITAAARVLEAARIDDVDAPASLMNQPARFERHQRVGDLGTRHA